MVSGLLRWSNAYCMNPMVVIQRRMYCVDSENVPGYGRDISSAWGYLASERLLPSQVPAVSPLNLFAEVMFLMDAIQ